MWTLFLGGGKCTIKHEAESFCERLQSIYFRALILWEIHVTRFIFFHEMGPKPDSTPQGVASGFCIFIILQAAQIFLDHLILEEQLLS